MLAEQNAQFEQIDWNELAEIDPTQFLIKKEEQRELRSKQANAQQEHYRIQQLQANEQNRQHQEMISVEWGKFGIRANWVSPGPIEGTEGVDRLIIQQGLADQVKERIPLGTFGEGDDIANAVVYLSSATGRYVSGTGLAVDGGSQWDRGR